MLDYLHQEEEPLKGQNFMIIAYVRVSTDKQTVENQRFEIENFCKNKNIQVDKRVEESESGTVSIEKRKLGGVLKTTSKGDIIICTELSRLGRSLMMIMSFLNYCLENEISIYTTKEGYILDDGINAKVLAFAFGLAAELERNLISQRTKEALKMRKAMGVQLGRREGSQNKKYKLDKHKEYIIKRWNEGKTSYYVAKHIHGKISTVNAYIKRLLNAGEIQPHLKNK